MSGAFPMPGSWNSGTSTPAHTREPTPIPKVPTVSSLEYPYGITEPLNQDKFLVEQKNSSKNKSPVSVFATPRYLPEDNSPFELPHEPIQKGAAGNRVQGQPTSSIPFRQGPIVIKRPDEEPLDMQDLNAPTPIVDENYSVSNSTSPTTPKPTIIPRPPSSWINSPASSPVGPTTRVVSEPMYHKTSYFKKPARSYDPSALAEESLNGTTSQDLNPNANNKRPIVIAVFGQTGTGKTSLIKAVTGEDLEIGHSLTSCTDEVRPVACCIEGHTVLLVDTPGFSDTHISDTEVLKRIANWMKDTYDDGLCLSGIVYLHRITDTRMDGPSMRNLRMMRKLCGMNSLKNVVLVTTMWENEDEGRGARREQELKNQFWKDMISGGSSVTRIMTNTRQDALMLIKSLLKNKPEPTQLQTELDEGRSLVETSAGTEIREEMLNMEKKFQEELESTKRELERAKREFENTNRTRHFRSLQNERQLRREMERNENELRREIEDIKHKQEDLAREKLELENATPKEIPKVARGGFFGLKGYRCGGGCGKQTNKMGRWTCSKCGYLQSNMW